MKDKTDFNSSIPTFTGVSVNIGFCISQKLKIEAKYIPHVNLIHSQSCKVEEKQFSDIFNI